jgi:hypothetical protein
VIHPGVVRTVTTEPLLESVEGQHCFPWVRGIFEVNSHVGMLFVDFIQGRRLRLQESATVKEEDALLVTYPGAQFMVRVQVTEVYNNCPRYIHTYQLVERSAYVPRGDRETLVPDWKRRDDMQVLLPANDPVRKLFSSKPESEGSSR